MLQESEPNVYGIISDLLQSLSRLGEGEPVSDRLALTAALPVLRRAALALPNPSERKQARSAYRMVAAALGVEHD